VFLNEPVFAFSRVRDRKSVAWKFIHSALSFNDVFCPEEKWIYFCHCRRKNFVLVFSVWIPFHL
jgi:hypothetical protein